MAPAIRSMLFGAGGVSWIGVGVAFTGGGGAGTAAKGAGSVTAVSARGAGAGARAAGGAALAGRAAVADRWLVVDVVVDLVDLVDLVVAGVAGSAVRVMGSSTGVADGSLDVGAAGVASGAGVAGACVTGCMASGAVWAIKAVEEKARTAAIADIAGRIVAFLWVMSGTTNDGHYGCVSTSVSGRENIRPPKWPIRRSWLSVRHVRA
jgi:hypothetical protein